MTPLPADHPTKYNAGAWNGDPLKIPPVVVKRLRSDEFYTQQFFANNTEAFNAGLAIGVAAARRANARQAG